MIGIPAPYQCTSVGIRQWIGIRQKLLYKIQKHDSVHVIVCNYVHLYLGIFTIIDLGFQGASDQVKTFVFLALCEKVRYRFHGN